MSDATERTAADVAEYLEELRAALASHDAAFRQLRMVEMEERLSPRPVAPATPTGPGANVVANTLGNVASFYGQRNLLLDPTLENLSGSVSGAEAILSSVNGQPAWYGTVVSGCGASPGISQAITRDDNNGNPLNSSIVALFSSTVTGAGTHELMLRSAYNGIGTPSVLPFLVAAVALPSALHGTSTSVTSKTVTLEIYDYQDATVRATTTVDATHAGSIFCSMLLAGTAWAAHDFSVRVRVTMVTTAAGDYFSKWVGEPQLNQAYSADPPPYQPVLGTWYPTSLRSGEASSTIRNFLNGESYARFVLDADGEAHYGGGTDDADLRVGRTAAGTLTIDDGAGGSVTLNIGSTAVLGARKTGWEAPTGTATRTTFATDTVTLIQLARRLKALIDDLTTHGLIGA